MDKKTQEKIKELEESIRKRDEYNRVNDNDWPKFDRRYERHIQLLKAGCKVEKTTHGFLVNGKYIVAARKYYWRIQGKNTWYAFRDIKSLVHRHFQ